MNRADFELTWLRPYPEISTSRQLNFVFPVKTAFKRENMSTHSRIAEIDGIVSQQAVAKNEGEKTYKLPSRPSTQVDSY